MDVIETVESHFIMNPVKSVYFKKHSLFFKNAICFLPEYYFKH
jgi:hypothetical protein